ncbi:MAG: flippase-like domain-containing protein [Candidatus Schekmanbacteria bacterium]|nr:flippase-like domain-containing protein [Candidatus Schekmanbacteria bacterium]
MFRKITTKKRIIFFCVYSTLILLLILLGTGGAKTCRALEEMRLTYLLLACLLAFIMTLVDALRLQVLTNALSTPVSFFYNYKTLLAYYFLSAITPTASGGEPLMIYMLKEKGVGVGKGTAIVVIRGILVIFFIALTGPLIIYTQQDLLANSILLYAFKIVAGILLVLITSLVYALYNPKHMEYLLEKGLHLLDKIPYFKKHSPHIVKKLDDWIEELNFSLKYFIRKKKMSLFWAAVLTVLFLLCNYSLAYVILKGLNADISLVRVLMLQVVLYFLLYFSPTPGGSGVAEGGFYMLFGPHVPQHILGILIILWRFFTTYLWVILGGLVIMKTLGIDQVETFAEEELKPVLEIENDTMSTQ